MMIWRRGKPWHGNGRLGVGSTKHPGAQHAFHRKSSSTTRLSSLSSSSISPCNCFFMPVSPKAVLDIESFGTKNQPENENQIENGRTHIANRGPHWQNMNILPRATIHSNIKKRRISTIFLTLFEPQTSPSQRFLKK